MNYFQRLKTQELVTVFTARSGNEQHEIHQCDRCLNRQVDLDELNLTCRCNRILERLDQIDVSDEEFELIVNEIRDYTDELTVNL